MNEIRKISKEKIKLRIGMSGASGFGKTWSALLIAYGITKDWNKIVLIEAGYEGVDLYDELTNGDANVFQMEAPFSPQKYIEAIKKCELFGAEVIIIDSITPEWDGDGGCLQMVESVAKKMRIPNSYTAWAEVTPLHNDFIRAILTCNAHVITTVRRKQDYEITKDNNNKTKVTKVGTKEITRDGFEYELTINFEFVNENHYVKCSKNRTSLFKDGEFIPTIETGELLRKFADKGVDKLAYFIESLNNCQSRTDGINLVRANPQFNKSAAQFNKVYSNNELLENAFEDFKIKFPAPPKVEVENTNIEN